MKKPYSLELKIPESASCEFVDGVLKCNKGDVALERNISVPGMEVSVDKGTIKLFCKKANKKDIAMVRASAAHVKNMLQGLDKKFVYEMEVCNVHFPITVKIEGNNFKISNFLGEKVNRSAKILDGVEIEVKGQKITISGNDIEKTGQTAANIEGAAKVPNKDRRVFQDGIFITSKPGGAI